MKKIYPVSGMHCTSCEALLQKEVLEIPSVTSVKASHKKGTLEIESSQKISDEVIQGTIEKCGYTMLGQTCVSAPVRSTPTKKDLLDIGVIALFFLLLSFLFSQFQISQYFPDISEKTGFGIAFLVGIVASLSTCLALTGGIVMSFSAEMSDHQSKARPQIFFHIGRVGGFFLLGGLLGLIGESVRYSIGFTGFLTLVVAIIMLSIGLHILKIVPSPSRFGLSLPKGMENHISTLQKKNHPLFPGIIGVLTFFLPCGFTQSMQIAAVASGSFWIGGLMMASFALGTLPVLFSVGMGSAYATSDSPKTHFFKKIVGVLIVFFGLYSFHSGLVLAGVTMPSFSFEQEEGQTGQTPRSAPTIGSAPIDEETSPPNLENGVQVVKMDINYIFEPSVFKIKKGIPVKFEIHATRISGCTDEVIIPSLGLSSGKLMNGDTKVLEFTPTKSGTLPFSCWMGMVTGKFVVE